MNDYENENNVQQNTDDIVSNINIQESKDTGTSNQSNTNNYQQPVQSNKFVLGILVGCGSSLLLAIVLIFFIVAIIFVSTPSKAKNEQTSSVESSVSSLVSSALNTDTNSDDTDSDTETTKEESKDKTSLVSSKTTSSQNSSAEESKKESNIETSTATSSQEESKAESDLVSSSDLDNNAFIEKHKYEIVASAKMTLDNYIADYQISLAPQKWTLAKFDDNDAVMATTDITYKGVVGDYIFIGTLNFDDKGRVESTTPHYVYALGTVFVDDGYCDEFFNNISEIMSWYN